MIAQRFRFYKRCQQSGESITECLAELRKIAAHCEFKTFLSEALRDRLVCGILCESTEKKLLSERDLTLDKAVDIAKGEEAAAKDAKELHQ